MRQLKRNADFVKPYVDRGWLGMKSGRGFYAYPDPAFQQQDFIAPAPDSGGGH
jgi:3-hydroxyacyl-CoA dehydrogenase